MYIALKKETPSTGGRSASARHILFRLSISENRHLSTGCERLGIILDEPPSLPCTLSIHIIYSHSRIEYSKTPERNYVRSITSAPPLFCSPIPISILSPFLIPIPMPMSQIIPLKHLAPSNLSNHPLSNPLTTLLPLPNSLLPRLTHPHLLTLRLRHHQRLGISAPIGLMLMCRTVQQLVQMRARCCGLDSHNPF